MMYPWAAIFLLPICITIGPRISSAGEAPAKNCASAQLSNISDDGVKIVNNCDYAINVSAASYDKSTTFTISDIAPQETRRAPISRADYKAEGGLVLVSCRSDAGAVDDQGYPWKDPTLRAICVPSRVSLPR